MFNFEECFNALAIEILKLSSFDFQSIHLLISQIFHSTHLSLLTPEITAQERNYRQKDHKSQLTLKSYFITNQRAFLLFPGLIYELQSVIFIRILKAS